MWIDTSSPTYQEGIVNINVVRSNDKTGAKTATATTEINCKISYFDVMPSSEKIEDINYTTATQTREVQIDFESRPASCGQAKTYRLEV